MASLKCCRLLRRRLVRPKCLGVWKRRPFRSEVLGSRCETWSLGRRFEAFQGILRAKSWVFEDDKIIEAKYAVRGAVPTRAGELQAQNLGFQ